MEQESEKRKERLKAMRMEAAQAGINSDSGNSMGDSQSLTNPLVEHSASPFMAVDSHASPRFDFYTDPMAAFSPNKRMSKVRHQNTPDYFTSPRPDLSHSSLHQTRINSSQDARMFQEQGFLHTSGHFGSPMGMSNPSGTPQGNTNFWGGPSGSPAYHYPPNFPRAVDTPNPSFRQGASPGLNYGRGRAHGFNYSPRAGFGYMGSPYSNLGRGTTSPQHGFGNRGTPFPGRGRSRGRGRGSLNYVSAEERPDRYYNKSMTEDPWKMLKPVIWKGKCIPSSSATAGTEKAWLPKSIASKKARVSEALDKYRSKQSLAEYLAASFNEAAHEPDEEDGQESI